VVGLPDSRRALSGSRDNTLKLWDLESGECLATWYADGSVGAIDVASPHRLAMGDAFGAVTVLDLVEE
jgi:WD40 repeat protein